MINILITWASSWFWRFLAEKLSEIVEYNIIAWFSIDKHQDIVSVFNKKWITSIDIDFHPEKDYYFNNLNSFDFDILILNAWKMAYGWTLWFSTQQIRYLFESNLIGHIWLLSYLFQNRNHGTQKKVKVIFMSSIASEMYIPGISLYSATKAGINVIIDHLREEYKAIYDIYNIMPWPFNTNLHRNIIYPYYPDNIVMPELAYNTDMQSFYEIISNIISQSNYWDHEVIIDNTIFKSKMIIILAIKAKINLFLKSYYHKIWK